MPKPKFRLFSAPAVVSLFVILACVFALQTNGIRVNKAGASPDDEWLLDDLSSEFTAGTNWWKETWNAVGTAGDRLGSSIHIAKTNQPSGWNFAVPGAGVYDIYLHWPQSAKLGVARFQVSASGGNHVKSVDQKLAAAADKTVENLPFEKLFSLTASQSSVISVEAFSYFGDMVALDAVFIVRSEVSGQDDAGDSGQNDGSDCNNNSVREGSEQCDGNDLNNKYCSDFGFSGGVLKCTSECLFDVGDCTALHSGPSESTIYIAGLEGLEVLDVSNLSYLHHAGKYSNKDTGLDSILEIAVSGNFAYVSTDDNNAITVFDVSDPEHPDIAGTIPDSQFAIKNNNSLIVSGNYAYAAVAFEQADGFQVLDISDPKNIQPVAKLQDSNNTALDSPVALEISGAFAYVLSETEGLGIINISDPLNPAYVSGLSLNQISDGDTEYEPRLLTAADNTLYVSSDDFNGLILIDISDPSDPEYLKTFKFATDIPADSLNRKNAEFIKKNGDKLYICHDRRSNGGLGGLSVVDISDSKNPSVIDYLDSVVCESLSFKGTYAFAGDVSDQSELVVLDISSPAELTVVNRYEQWKEGEALNNQSVLVKPQIVNVADNYLYFYELNNDAFQIFDIKNPRQIKSAGLFPGEENVFLNDFIRHPSEFTDALKRDNLIYAVTNTKGITVLEVSDQAHPEVIGIKDLDDGDGYVDGGTSIALKDDYAYAVYGSAVVVTNVSDPADIKIVNRVQVSQDFVPVKVKAIDNNLYVMGENSFAVMDVSDPVNPDVLYVSGAYHNLDYAIDFEVYVNYLFIGGNSAGVSALEIYNISDPADPLYINNLAGSLETRKARDVYVKTGRLYIFGENEIEIFSLTDPADPGKIGHINLENVNNDTWYGRLMVSGSHLFVAVDYDVPEETRFEIYDLSDLSDPQKISTLTDDRFTTYFAQPGAIFAAADENPIIPAICNNNGVREGTEQCDGNDLNNKNCSDFGNFTGGSLACNNQCNFDTGGCLNVPVSNEDTVTKIRNLFKEMQVKKGLGTDVLYKTTGELVRLAVVNIINTYLPNSVPISNQTAQYELTNDGRIDAGDTLAVINYTTDPDSALCGNARLQTTNNEDCDGEETGSLTCGDFGFSFGKVRCNNRGAGIGQEWERYELPGQFEGFSAGESAFYPADINGDGRADLVNIVSGGSVGQYRLIWYESDGQPAPSYTKHEISSEIAGDRALAVADIDGDGHLDIVTVYHSVSAGFKNVWFKNNGGRTPPFTTHTLDGIAGMDFLLADDLTGDGHADIVSVLKDSGKVVVYQNRGTNPVAFDSLTLTTESGAHQAFSADMNKDGKKDIVLHVYDESDSQRQYAVWFEQVSDSPLRFERHSLNGVNIKMNKIALVDFEGDGNPDIIGSAYSSQLNKWSLLFFSNNGATPPVFGVIPLKVYSEPITSLFVTNLDKDNRKDVLLSLDGDESDPLVWLSFDGGRPTDFTQHVINSQLNNLSFIYPFKVDNDEYTDVMAVYCYDADCTGLAWYQANFNNACSADSTLCNNCGNDCKIRNLIRLTQQQNGQGVNKLFKAAAGQAIDEFTELMSKFPPVNSIPLNIQTQRYDLNNNNIINQTDVLALINYKDNNENPLCGNGVRQAGNNEECDGGDLNGKSCSDFGKPYGELYCREDCTFDTRSCSTNDNYSRVRELIRTRQEELKMETDVLYLSVGRQAGEEIVDLLAQYSPNEPPLNDETEKYDVSNNGHISPLDVASVNSYLNNQQSPLCGNGVRQAGNNEECDGDDLNDQTCPDLGYAGGTLSCGGGCMFNKEKCQGTAEYAPRSDAVFQSVGRSKLDLELGNNFSIEVRVTNKNTNKPVQAKIYLRDQNGWGGLQEEDVPAGKSKTISIQLEVKEFHMTYNPHVFEVELNDESVATYSFSILSGPADGLPGNAGDEDFIIIDNENGNFTGPGWYRYPDDTGNTSQYIANFRGSYAYTLMSVAKGPASWAANKLAAGEYKIYVTWPGINPVTGASDWTDRAVFRVKTSDDYLKSFDYNLQQEPVNDITKQNRPFQHLDTVRVTADASIIVELEGQGFIAADAVILQRLPDTTGDSDDQDNNGGNDQSDDDADSPDHNSAALPPYLYVNSSYVLDVRDARSPQLLNPADTGNPPILKAVSNGTWGYAVSAVGQINDNLPVTFTLKLKAYDLTEEKVDKSRPVFESVVKDANKTDDLIITNLGDYDIRGNYLFLLDDSRLRQMIIIDISDPHHPYKVKDFSHRYFYRVHEIAIYGHYAYISGGWPNTSEDYRNAIGIVDISNPLTLSNLSNKAVIEMDGVIHLQTSDEGLLIVSEHDNYLTSMVNDNNGKRAAIYSLNDPVNPKLLARINTASAGSNLSTFWSFEFNNDYLYIGGRAKNAAAGPIDIYDLSDPGNPVKIGNWSSNGSLDWPLDSVPADLFLLRESSLLAPFCQDDDGGYTAGSAGTVTLFDGYKTDTVADVCLHANILKEVACSELNKEAAYKYFYCSCSNGACAGTSEEIIPPFCFETDGGQIYGQPGTTVLFAGGQITQETDQCDNGNQRLKEFYCQNNQIKFNWAYCSCSNGACIGSLSDGSASSAASSAAPNPNPEPDPKVTLTADKTIISENGGKAKITAALSKLSSSTVTVEMQYKGTAQIDTDYSVPIFIAVPPGQLNAFVELEAKADSVTEGSETVEAEIKSVTNGQEQGSQKVVITIQETSGNGDKISPEITLLGKNPLELELGDDFTDPGATAKDDVDGDLTDKIQVSGTVNTAKAGTYKITYSVADTAGNSISKERTVVVKEFSYARCVNQSKGNSNEKCEKCLGGDPVGSGGECAASGTTNKEAMAECLNKKECNNVVFDACVAKSDGNWNAACEKCYRDNCSREEDNSAAVKDNCEKDKLCFKDDVQQCVDDHEHNTNDKCVDCLIGECPKNTNRAFDKCHDKDPKECFADLNDNKCVKQADGNTKKECQGCLEGTCKQSDDTDQKIKKRFNDCVDSGKCNTPEYMACVKQNEGNYNNPACLQCYEGECDHDKDNSASAKDNCERAEKCFDANEQTCIKKAETELKDEAEDVIKKCQDCLKGECEGADRPKDYDDAWEECVAQRKC